MKQTVYAAIAGLVLFSLCFAHSGDRENPPDFTKHFHDSLFAISDKGQVSIEVLLDEKEYKIGSDVIGIVVHDSHDQDVDNAKLLVTASGASGPFKVRDKGDGLYVVSKKGLLADGRWELKISVKKGGIDDSVIFRFPDITEKKLAAGKYRADSLNEKR